MDHDRGLRLPRRPHGSRKRRKFLSTDNKVVNDIYANFTFADGLILSHIDRFDLWKWTRMALGAKGVLLGWLPPVQNAVRKQASAGLKLFIAEQDLTADNVVH